MNSDKKVISILSCACLFLMAVMAQAPPAPDSTKEELLARIADLEARLRVEQARRRHAEHNVQGIQMAQTFTQEQAQIADMMAGLKKNCDGGKGDINPDTLACTPALQPATAMPPPPVIKQDPRK